jgi:hypothetical protein
MRPQERSKFYQVEKHKLNLNNVESNLLIEKITSENKEGLEEYTALCKNLDLFPVDISDMIDRFRPYFEGLYVVRELNGPMVAGVCLFYECYDNRMTLTRFLCKIGFWSKAWGLLIVFCLIMVLIFLIFYWIAGSIGNETVQLIVSIVLAALWIVLAVLLVKGLILIRKAALYMMGKKVSMRASGEFCTLEGQRAKTVLRMLGDHIMNVAKQADAFAVRFNCDKSSPVAPLIIPNYSAKRFNTNFMVKFIEPHHFSSPVLTPNNFFDVRGL